MSIGNRGRTPSTPPRGTAADGTPTIQDVGEGEKRAATGKTGPVSSRGRTPLVPPRWRRRWNAPHAMRRRSQAERSHRSGAIGGAQQLAEDIVARGERFRE